MTDATIIELGKVEGAEYGAASRRAGIKPVATLNGFAYRELTLGAYETSRAPRSYHARGLYMDAFRASYHAALT